MSRDVFLDICDALKGECGVQHILRAWLSGDSVHKLREVITRQR
jgi:hypothetical protein